MLWMVLGAAAIIAAVLNVVWMFRHQDARWFRFISLSLTALTTCAIYASAGQRVLNEDWSALMDVVPSVSKGIWFLTIASILINGISLFQKRDQ